MADLKPLGSEKLKGQDKINRIMEIARYKENTPNTLNETSSSQYVIPMADGNEYQIVKEKLGYIIKKTISESSTDYIEPMKNRKYFPSYSQALKRLNLLAKELNRLNENEEGIELFGEQKKFVLKTPKPAPAPEAEAPMPPAEPPAVPAPALPPSPETTSDMGPEEMSPEVDASAEMDAEVTTPDGEMDIEAGIELLTGRIGHVQFADCPGRGAPGSGELVFAPLLRRLRESGYQGWLGAEYRPAGPTAASLDWLAQWRAAMP